MKTITTNPTIGTLAESKAIDKLTNGLSNTKSSIKQNLTKVVKPNFTFFSPFDVSLPTREDMDTIVSELDGRG